MSTGICKSPASRYWRALYKAAVSGIDMSKLPERMAEAEKAVVLRARELFQAADDNGEEKDALARAAPESQNGEPLALPDSLS
jgi:hypothetical protein